jgi:hypothetical protein
MQLDADEGEDIDIIEGFLTLGDFAYQMIEKNEFGEKRIAVSM